MMKKHPKIFLALLVAGLLVLGCALYLFSPRSLDEEGIIKKALQKADKITSYYALLEIVSKAGESTGCHFAEVWFRSPNCYRMEIFPAFPGAGDAPEQFIVSDGEKHWLFNPNIGDSFELGNMSGDFSPYYYLPVTFLKGLSQVQEAKLMEIDKTEKGVFYILRLIPQSPVQRHAWEKVWLEKKSFLPSQINIYDFSGRLQQRIIFHEIKLNPEINEEMFKL